MTRRVWLLTAVVALQSLMLMGMIANKQITLSTGTPILLETQPIDPRSLFQGDYVRLNYSVGTMQVNQKTAEAFHEGDRAFTVLQQDGKYWKAVSIHAQRPEPAPGQLVMRGEVESVNSFTKDEVRLHEVRIDYGIGNYFVPEGEGRNLERPAGQVIDVQVAVDGDGDAAIRALLLNGEAVYAETLF